MNILRADIEPESDPQDRSRTPATAHVSSDSRCSAAERLPFPASGSRFPVPDSQPLVAGIDEAGRGPLAGPVVVAAVVFDPARPRINGLDDSKRLSAARRETLSARIIERALAWRIVFVDAGEIDRVNIFQATMLGMQRALHGVLEPLQGRTCVARIDGNHLPRALPCAAEACIGGDARDRSIMAASILAKVARDRWMCELHDTEPRYGFDRHKGYSSPRHLAALREHGPCPQHRRSFAPVWQAEQRDLLSPAVWADER